MMADQVGNQELMGLAGKKVVRVGRTALKVGMKAGQADQAYNSAGKVVQVCKENLECTVSRLAGMMVGWAGTAGWMVKGLRCMLVMDACQMVGIRLLVAGSCLMVQKASVYLVSLRSTDELKVYEDYISKATFEEIFFTKTQSACASDCSKM